MKKLPNIYKNTINKVINNNKDYCYLKKETITYNNNIEEEIKNIFNGKGYPYNIKVYIKTKDTEYYTYLVATTNNTITTLDNDTINKNDIIELRKLK